MEATQVGLVWRLARRVVAAHSDVTEENFVDIDPWQEQPSGDTDPQGQQQPQTQGNSSGVKERVLKMNALIDQHDDSEHLPPNAMEVDKWYQNYIAIMGSQPDETEEPTANQLAALRKKIFIDIDGSRCAPNLCRRRRRRLKTPKMPEDARRPAGFRTAV
jgi:hypothetical protein